MNEFLKYLMDKPSIESDSCAICSKRATNQHHVVLRSQGGANGPTITLCGSGTTGCHGMAHDKRLHLYWDDGWVYQITDRPMNDFACWTNRRSYYSPVPGWASREVERIFGRR